MFMIFTKHFSVTLIVGKLYFTSLTKIRGKYNYQVVLCMPVFVRVTPCSTFEPDDRLSQNVSKKIFTVPLQAICFISYSQ